MWEWLMNELYNAVKIVGLNTAVVSAEEDDIVNEALMHLFQYQDTAEMIYKKHNKTYLIKIVKGVIKGLESREYNKYRWDFVDWQKINDICCRYSILPYPYNAYKINALLEHENKKTSCLSIGRIESLLKNRKTPIVFLNPHETDVFENGVKI